MTQDQLPKPDGHVTFLMGALGYEMTQRGVQSVLETMADLVKARPDAESNPRLQNIVAALTTASERVAGDDSRIQFGDAH